MIQRQIDEVEFVATELFEFVRPLTAHAIILDERFRRPARAILAGLGQLSVDATPARAGEDGVGREGDAAFLEKMAGVKTPSAKTAVISQVFLDRLIAIARRAIDRDPAERVRGLLEAAEIAEKVSTFWGQKVGSSAVEAALQIRAAASSAPREAGREDVR